MARSFDELLTVPSLDDARSQVLSVLRGLGIVRQSSAAAGAVGQGSGSVVLSGSPIGAYSCVVKIVTSGEIGAAQYQLSTDGGATFGATTTTTTGAVAIGTTGAKMTFVAGSVGPSFADGDSYSFDLAAAHFPTAEQPGSVARALWEVDAQAHQDVRALVAAIAAGGLLETASGDWLTLLARNVYSLDRQLATVAKGLVTLADTAGAGPFTIAPGGMTVASTTGLRFTVTTGGTIPKSGTVSLEVMAESPGAAYDVGNGTITSIVAGTLPGVTVTNPDPGSGSWLTVQGVDEETDAALRARCSARWGAMGAGGTEDFYELVAKGAASGVTRVAAYPHGSDEPGQVDIIIAGPAGGSPQADVDAVNAAVQSKLPLTVTTVVSAAVDVAIDVTATVYYQGSQSAAQAAVESNLQNYVQGIGIGSVDSTQNCYIAALVERIMEAAGVVNVALTAPAADVSISAGHVATVGTFSITYELST